MSEDSRPATVRQPAKTPDYHPVGTLNTHDGQQFGRHVIGDILATAVDRDLIVIGDGVTAHEPWRRLTRRQAWRHVRHLMDALEAAERWSEAHQEPPGLINSRQERHPGDETGLVYEDEEATDDN